MQRDSDRDYYMTSFEAKDYGLVDQVVQSRKEIRVEPPGATAVDPEPKEPKEPKAAEAPGA